jgi:hypothetical protein
MLDVPRELARLRAILIPDGLPVWTAQAMPGHLQDPS